MDKIPHSALKVKTHFVKRITYNRDHEGQLAEEGGG